MRKLRTLVDEASADSDIQFNPDMSELLKAVLALSIGVCMLVHFMWLRLGVKLKKLINVHIVILSLVKQTTIVCRNHKSMTL